MKTLIKNYIENESGATAIEYAMLAGLVGLGIVTAADSLGARVNWKFYVLRNAVRDAGVK